MIDSDNVLLLRPARTNSGFYLENLNRPPHANKEDLNGLVVATIYHLRGGTQGDFVDFFECEVAPKLKNVGATILATFVTENHPNTFPKLPVREGVNVFVSFLHFAARPSYQQHAAIFTNWFDGRGLAEKASMLIEGPAEVLLLEPTPRSLLR